MTELNVKYPATQPKPKPSAPGVEVHSYLDLTPHQGEDVYLRYADARSEEERDTLLRDMPRATVTFHELPEGEEFFDVEDRPRDKNGFAIWDTVWIKEAANIGSIEAAHGDEYQVQVGDKMLRVKANRIKPLNDLTDEEEAVLERFAAEERSAYRAA